MPESPAPSVVRTATFETVEDPVVQVTVHFNPASLQYTVSNTLQEEGEGAARKQYVSKTTAKLTMDLVFDTTDTGEDVRTVTNNMAKLLEPIPEQNDKKVPPRVTFSWGAYAFTGMVEQYKETIDFFADGGLPLRSTINLTLASQDVVFDAGTRSDKASVDADITAEPVVVPDSEGPGGGPAGAASAAGDPRAARAIGAANGSASLRFGAGGALAVGASASVGFSAGASVGAGFSAGIGASAGGGASASAGAGLSAAAGGGAGANLLPAATFVAGGAAGASAGAGLGIGAGGGAGFGVSAGAGLGIGAGAGASAGAGLGVSAGAGFGASAGAGAGLSASAGTGIAAGAGFSGLRTSTTVASRSLSPSKLIASTPSVSTGGGVAAGGRLSGGGASSGLRVDVGADADFEIKSR